jgi:hypothetical protein
MTLMFRMPRGPEHVNEHVPVPLSTADGPKQQLTTALCILTPYLAVHRKKNQIVYVYVYAHTFRHIYIVCVCIYECVCMCVYVYVVSSFLQCTESYI